MPMAFLLFKEMMKKVKLYMDSRDAWVYNRQPEKPYNLIIN